jgi:hypothetical protein
MSRPAGPDRQALLAAIRNGITGTYEALAHAAGVEPGRARATLKEIRRAGQAGADCRQRAQGRGGAGRLVYADQQPGLDALAYVRQAWR